MFCDGAGRAHGEKLRVAHVLKDYLPYSCPWIFHQIVGPKDLETITVAWEGSIAASRAFPNPGLMRLRQADPVRYSLTRLLSPGGVRLIASSADTPLRRFSPHLVHAHFGNYAWFYLPVTKRMNLPLVVSFYGYDMSELPASKPVWKRRYAELFEYARLFFCEGPAMAAALKRLGCPGEKVRIQRLGVDCSRLAVQPRVFQPGRTLKVLLASRMTEKKGIPDAVRAVALASRQIPIHLTIVGGPAPGRKGREEKKKILKAIKETGAGEYVRLAGAVSYRELFQIAAGHHVLLQPSRTSSTGDSEGGIPVSLIELGGSGMPAVSTRHADIPEVVLDGETGFLTEEGDSDGQAAALIRLATTPELINRMGQAMARHVDREFQQDKCLAQLVRHYREAVGQ
jgi:colanic acid/amylovoran biosynthesis glycosyltransferase